VSRRIWNEESLDFLKFLRRKDWKDLPVMMLSTEAAGMVVDKGMSIGADA
jgi:hypothetical protein